MNHRKYLMSGIALAACVLVAASFQAYGQGRGATRVRFKRGQLSTTVKGQLSQPTAGTSLFSWCSSWTRVVLAGQSTNERRLGFRHSSDL